MASCEDPSPFSSPACNGPGQGSDIFSRDALNRGIRAFLSQGYSSWIIAGTLGVILLSSAITRVRSSSQRITKRPDGTIIPPLLPYWLAIVGSGIDFIWDKTAFLRKAKDQLRTKVFSVFVNGSIRNIVWDPSLITSIFHDHQNTDFGEVQWSTMHNIFGMSSKYREQYGAASEDLNALYATYLVKEPQSSEVLGSFVRNLESSLPDLVSFCASQIDQTNWEREAYVEVVQEGDEAYEFVDANLNELLRNFVGYMATPCVFGSAFLENYPEGGLMTDLSSFDRARTVLGIPRWVPWPSITRAHITRRKLINALTSLQYALDREVDEGDAGTDYGDLDDVSQLIRERHAVYRKHNLPAPARASSELALLWELNANSNALISWMLLRIYSTPGLLEELRKELANHVSVSYPEAMLGFSVTPTTKIDLTGIYDNCLLLRSTFYETLRLHNQPTSVRRASKNLVVSAQDATEEKKEKYFLEKGSWIEMPHALHQLDPSSYEDPLQFKPDRFLGPSTSKAGEGKTKSINTGSMRPFGGGVSACKGQLFAEKECLAVAAGVIMAWEMQPVKTKTWQVPNSRTTTAVVAPVKDVRVRLRRRKPRARVQ